MKRYRSRQGSAVGAQPMPNAFAYLMILMSPVLVAVLLRRLPLDRAIVWVVLGAYLVLPPKTGFDLPMIPTLDKDSLPPLAALLLCTFMLGARVPLLPESRGAGLLMLLFIFSPIVTVMNNAEPVVNGQAFVPGLRVYDAFGAVGQQMMVVTPLLLARQFLATPRALREILLALALGGLAYSIPMLVEIRLSPQINVWVYGFFQHDFIQMMREGGYRPIVFLPHGIWLAFFALMATVAAAALAHTAPKGAGGRYRLATGYLLAILVLCKSKAALAYSLILLPLVTLLGQRRQIQVAAVIVVVAVLYPLLRGGNLVPTDAIVAQSEAAFGSDRAASLRYRYHNEHILIARAGEKPVFGWGPWGRNHIYDPISGDMVSVIDGRWILTMGSYGWVGYIAEFGLLGYPILLLLRRWRPGPAASPHVGAIALLLAFNLADMLLNATLIPFTWLMAGAMLGHAEALARNRRGAAVQFLQDPDVAAAPEPPRAEARPRTIL